MVCFRIIQFYRFLNCIFLSLNKSYFELDIINKIEVKIIIKKHLKNNYTFDFNLIYA